MINNYLYKQIKDYIFSIKEQYNISNTILGLSAGVDSIVLFDILNKIFNNEKNITFAIAYLNHQQRKESRKDEELCKILSEKYNIALYLGSLSNRNKKILSETAMRIERYNFFNSLINKYNIDAFFTAHHLDDQIETYFMRRSQTKDKLILKGIRKENGIFFRPLLDIPKEEIFSYAINENLVWNEDKTNSNNMILRNKIRNKILPKLYADNLDYKHNLLKEIKLNNNESDLIIKNVKNFINNNISHNDEKIFIDIKDLYVLDDCTIKYILKKIYRLILKKNFYLSEKHFNSFKKYLFNKKNNIYFNLGSSINIYKTNGNLVLYKMKVSKNTKILVNVGGVSWLDSKLKVNKDPKIIKISDKNSIYIDKKTFKNGVFLRTWENGDKITYNANGNKKKIKKIFSEFKILPFDRYKIPLLVNSENEVLWIIGLRKIYRNNERENNFIELRWEINK